MWLLLFREPALANLCEVKPNTPETTTTESESYFLDFYYFGLPDRTKPVNLPMHLAKLPGPI